MICVVHIVYVLFDDRGKLHQWNLFVKSKSFQQSQVSDKLEIPYLHAKPITAYGYLAQDEAGQLLMQRDTIPPRVLAILQEIGGLL